MATVRTVDLRTTNIEPKRGDILQARDGRLYRVEAYHLPIMLRCACKLEPLGDDASAEQYAEGGVIPAEIW